MAAGPAFGGAWTLPKGQGQLIATATVTQADQSFDHDWVAHKTPRYRKFDMPFLFEYGATDDFTAIVSPSLQHVDIAAPYDAERTGPGYTEFGARYRLLHDKDWVFSAQGTMRIPGTVETDNPAAIGYTFPEFDARALFGRTFTARTRPAFVDLEVAQRFRGGGAPNEFRADLTFGLQATRRWLLLAQMFNVVSEGSGSRLFPSYNYSKVELSAVYSINEHWAVSLAAFPRCSAATPCRKTVSSPASGTTFSAARLAPGAGAGPDAAQHLFGRLALHGEIRVLAPAGVRIAQPAPNQHAAHRRPIERAQPVAQDFRLQQRRGGRRALLGALPGHGGGALGRADADLADDHRFADARGKRVEARDHAVDRRPMRRTVVVGAERRIERDADAVELVPERHLLGAIDIMRHVNQRTGKDRPQFVDQRQPFRPLHGSFKLGADHEGGRLLLGRHARDMHTAFP